MGEEGPSGGGNGAQPPRRAAEPKILSAAAPAPPGPAGGPADRLRAPPKAGGLQGQLSAVLREELLAELTSLDGPDAAADWAHKRLAAKNTLTDADARQVEEAFAFRVAAFESGEEPVTKTAAAASGSTVNAAIEEPPVSAATEEPTAQPGAWPPAAPLPDWLGPPDPEPVTIPAGVDKSVLPIGAPRRFRNKAHLTFVAAQPCLVCGRRPVDPHHVRFAQGQALGRKVSDEFTVPLCRSHHRALHRSGSEYLWWENIGIDPLKAARKLWRKTRSKGRTAVSGGCHGPRTTPPTVAAVTPATARTQPSAQKPALAAQERGNDRP